MPKLYNTVTKKFMWAPDSYRGRFPFVTEEEAAAQGIADPEIVVEEPVVQAPKKKKATKAEYKEDATDGDGDGLVQDGTIFQRPEGTSLSDEEIETRLAEDSE